MNLKDGDSLTFVEFLNTLDEQQFSEEDKEKISKIYERISDGPYSVVKSQISGFFDKLFVGIDGKDLQAWEGINGDKMLEKLDVDNLSRNKPCFYADRVATDEITKERFVNGFLSLEKDLAVLILVSIFGFEVLVFLFFLAQKGTKTAGKKPLTIKSAQLRINPQKVSLSFC
jgi:hypothetical protein